MNETNEKEIYLIRHGSLPDACRHALVGQNDTPLSARGVEEAEAAGRFLRDIAWDAVYAGTLRRVEQTLAGAALANSRLAEQAQRDPRLNEMNFGEWNMRKIDRLDPDDAALLAQWNPGNWDFRFPGGETMQTFAERTRAAWRDILAAPGERIAIFSHGGVIMSLLADLVGLDRKHAFSLWVERGGLARTRVDAATGRGRVSLIGKPIDWD